MTHDFHCPFQTSGIGPTHDVAALPCLRLSSCRNPLFSISIWLDIFCSVVQFTCIPRPVALGKEGAKVPQAKSRFWFLALMRAVGGGTLGYSIGYVVRLVHTFRTGEIWAAWAVASGGLWCFQAGSLSAMRIVRQYSSKPAIQISPIGFWALVVNRFSRYPSLREHSDHQVGVVAETIRSGDRHAERECLRLFARSQLC